MKKVDLRNVVADLRFPSLREGVDYEWLDNPSKIDTWDVFEVKTFKAAKVMAKGVRTWCISISERWFNEYNDVNLILYIYSNGKLVYCAVVDDLEEVMVYDTDNREKTDCCKTLDFFCRFFGLNKRDLLDKF